MIDQSTNKGRIIAAALRLAAERPWREVTLADIAAGAGLTLQTLRTEVASKSGVIALFTRAIDDQLLATQRAKVEGQSPRDALFDVIMARFDALAPYRSALRSMLARPSPVEPDQVKAFLASQRWMLAAAGIGAEGVRGGIKTAGLASVYASVFRTWLDDDDPGMARTMASLDRRLRRSEDTLGTIRDIEKTVCRVACAFMPGARAKKADDTSFPEPPSAAPGGEHPMPS